MGDCEIWTIEGKLSAGSVHPDVLVVGNTHVDEKLFDAFTVVALDDDLLSLVRIFLLLLTVALAVLVFPAFLTLLR